MDLYSILTLETILLVPFVLYFLFLRRRGRSLYSNRDFFYPIKLYLAKKVVRLGQEKSKKHREKHGYNRERDVTFSSKQHTHYQSFQGCDQKGNDLTLKFTLRSTKLAEVTLVLKLANGSVYTFPGSQKVHLTSIKDNQWKINGLVIESLEPHKRARLVYNGLLQNVSCKSYEKIDHVQFNFIFNCCSAPKFYPEDADTNLIAETLATRPWKDGSWKEFLKYQSRGYEQFGTLLGFIKGDAFPEEQVLNLPACRSNYGGPDERFMFDREIKLFLAETNGVLIKLNIQSFEDQDQSQINYGYICHKNNITVPITDQDIRIRHLGKKGSLPDVFVTHINTKTEEYKCVFNINKSSVRQAQSPTGFEIFNVNAECDVNTSHGKSLIEFTYYKSTSDIKTPKLKPVLCDVKVDAIPEDFVVNIKEDHAKILELTGGKGNSLALLASLGAQEFMVPDGFVLTVNAFKRQLSENALLQKIVRNIDDIFCRRKDGKQAEICAEAVRIFQNEPVHPEIAEYIIASLREVKEDSANDSIDVVSWAVRSSAIGEDSEELSAAGQNETILGCVTEGEVLKAVPKCWASLFAYQSVQYRWQHGLPVIADMAVVVQKMVPADSAGVLFTWHPTSSNPSQMIITSNYGLGESVVSGKTDPDTFILNRTYDGVVCLLDQIMGTKEKALTLTENGVKEVSLGDDQEGSFIIVNGKDVKEKWSITKEQATALGKVGVLLEEAFGGPRDIEWAFYKEDLYLLQSRPITTLNAWTEFELTHELDTAVTTENSIFTMANTGEVFPLATSALTRTRLMEAVDKGIQLNVGSVAETYFLKCLCSFQHRVMLDVILSIHMNSRQEEIQISSKILDLAIFGHQVINDQINAMIFARWGPISSVEMAKQFFQQFGRARKVREYVQKTEDFARSLDLGIKDGDSLEEIYHKITDNRGLNIPAYYHSATSAASVLWQILCMSILVGKNKDLKTEHYVDFANILSSCEDVVSAEVPMYLLKIAKIIKEEGYAEEFCTIKAEFGVDWMKTKCPAAYNVFEEFLRNHGHRCLGEFELMEETWGTKPSLVIPMIQANAKHFTESVKEHKTVDQVLGTLTSPVNFVTKRILKYIITNLRVSVGKREQSKSATILARDKFTVAYKKLAQEMVRQGLIPAENLIFHLTSFELGALIRKRNPLLVNKAMKRQRLYPKWNKLKFPELIYGFPEPDKEIDTPIELLAGTKCTGTPVCTGSVQARACVISNLDDIGQLEKGDILITYCTDIGWSPYFPMLSGVVTELGGLVSHGAVVAREYGLPCIVGVKNVTKLFRTGDIVYLSGTTGELGKM